MATSTTESPELKTYTGCCHCGDFKYTLRVPEIKEAMACNCSLCSVKGFLYLFPGKKEALTVERGEEGLKEYTFGKGMLQFKFCPKCGSCPLVRSKEDVEGHSYAINLRSLQGLDIWSLKLKSFDGASRPSTYTRPEPMAHTLTPADGQKVYTGGCHCGAIRLAVALQPLPTASVTEDQCSICKRNACTMHYLHPSLLQLDPPDAPALVGYKFNTRRSEHQFCGECSVQVMIDQPAREKVGVNVRCLRDVEWEGGEVGAEGRKDSGKVFVLRRMGDWGEEYVIA